MHDELTRAAAQASKALGMSVEWRYVPSPSPVTWTGSLMQVEVYDAMDSNAGEQPIESCQWTDDTAALAYLEGLECGARIVRERHARLRRSADDTYLWCRTHIPDFRLTDICQSLSAGLAETEALSQLED